MSLKEDVLGFTEGDKKGDSPNFARRIFLLIQAADPRNRARIKLAWPNAYEVFEAWNNSPQPPPRPTFPGTTPHSTHISDEEQENWKARTHAWDDAVAHIPDLLYDGDLPDKCSNCGIAHLPHQNTLCPL